MTLTYVQCAAQIQTRSQSQLNWQASVQSSSVHAGKATTSNELSTPRSASGITRQEMRMYVRTRPRPWCRLRMSSLSTSRIQSKMGPWSSTPEIRLSIPPGSCDFDASCSCVISSAAGKWRRCPSKQNDWMHCATPGAKSTRRGLKSLLLAIHDGMRRLSAGTCPKGQGDNV